MRTQKQIEASRANGRKSKGPVTTLGKYLASQNGVTHGLFLPIPRTTTEDGRVIAEICSHLIAERNATTPDEISQAKHDAYTQWKLHKIRTTGLTYCGMPVSPFPKAPEKALEKRFLPSEPGEVVDFYRNRLEATKHELRGVPR